MPATISPTIVVWIALNLAMSWSLDLLLGNGIAHFIVGMWFPALSAIAFARYEGLPLKQTLNLQRGTWASYGMAAGFAVAVGLLTVSLGQGLGYLRLNPTFELSLVNTLLTLGIWCLASLGEEIGWRGYLLERLKAVRHAPLYIGLIWSAWHFRDLWQAKPGDVLALAMFTALVVVISYFLAWLIASGGSVWACTVFHGTWNCLRMKVFFGNPPQGPAGMFVSSAPNVTEMEGWLGLLSALVIGGCLMAIWQRRPRPAQPDSGF